MFVGSWSWITTLDISDSELSCRTCFGGLDVLLVYCCGSTSLWRVLLLHVEGDAGRLHAALLHAALVQDQLCEARTQLWFKISLWGLKRASGRALKAVHSSSLSVTLGCYVFKAFGI